jgi:protein-tyrosine phosphatase
MKGWHDSMKVEFDDVTHTLPVQGMTVVPFDESMGVTVLDFIEKNNGNPFIIHCDAGMSRSVAVACFMELCYNYSPVYHTINHDGMRNILVLNILRREWMKRNGIDMSLEV